MFQELMASIWEEFARVIFHVEVNIEPAQAEQMFGAEEHAGAAATSSTPAPPARSGRRRSARPRRGRRRRHAPPARRAAQPASRRRATARASTRPPWSSPTTRRSAATTPVGAARARSTRSATGHSGRRAGVARWRSPHLARPGRLAGGPDGDDLRSRLRLQPQRHVPRRARRSASASCPASRRRPTPTATTSSSVPDDTDVTPYIEPPPGYHQIDLQTFHTRGKAIRERQLPDPRRCRVQRARGAALGAARPGRPARAVRDRHHRLGAQRARRRLRDLPGAHPARRARGDGPHEAARCAGPIYFNESVIPDRSRTRDLGRRRDHLDRGPGRGPTAVITESAPRPGFGRASSRPASRAGS